MYPTAAGPRRGIDWVGFGPELSATLRPRAGEKDCEPPPAAQEDDPDDELDGSLFTASYHKESDAFVYVTYPTIKTAIEFVASTSITISNEDGSGYKIKYEPKLDLTITTRTNETYLYGWVYTSGIPCTVTTLEKLLAAWLRNMNLTLRNNSITQKKDREEDTNCSEFRFEFDSPENPNANAFIRKNQIALINWPKFLHAARTVPFEKVFASFGTPISDPTEERPG